MINRKGDPITMFSSLQVEFDNHPEKGNEKKKNKRERERWNWIVEFKGRCLNWKIIRKQKFMRYRGRRIHEANATMLQWSRFNMSWTLDNKAKTNKSQNAKEVSYLCLQTCNFEISTGHLGEVGKNSNFKQSAYQHRWFIFYWSHMKNSPLLFQRNQYSYRDVG